MDRSLWDDAGFTTTPSLPGQRAFLGKDELLGVLFASAHPAARFILTGERPEVVPLELIYQRRRRVFNLNFAPWISERTFRKAYRKCQQIVQGGDNRRMQERTLAVMRFVTKHTDDEGKRLLSWSQLTDLWNEEHPGEWSFKGRSGLRKAYVRAVEELVADSWH